MYCKEVMIYFSLLQNSSRSTQANIVDRHAELAKNISRETILAMVIIIFGYRSFEKSELTKLTRSFFLLPVGKTAGDGKYKNKKRKQASKL